MKLDENPTRAAKSLAGKAFLRYRERFRNHEDSAGAEMGVLEMDLRATQSVGLLSPGAGGHEGYSHGEAIRLLIMDHTPTRAGIKIALADQVDVCGEASDAESAIRAAKREQPDIALVGTGISAQWCGAVRGICRAAPRCAVVVLADAEDPDDLLECVRAGAVGYVPGPLEVGRLHRVFQAVLQGEAIVPRGMVSELLSELRGGVAAAGDALTSRETQVLGMLRRGHSTARIAERLEITPVTVRRHISELVRKLGVESRTDLIQSVG